MWDKVLSDLRFRQAVNMAVNREEIADAVFLGFVGPSKIITPGEFSVSKANRLLDQMGLDKRDSDGFRIGPDGNTFEMPFESSSYLGDEPLVAELVVEHLREVGIKATTKIIDGGLHGKRRGAGEIKVYVDRNHGVMWTIPVFSDLTPGGSRAWGIEWGKWNESGGKEGEVPPKDLQRLFKVREEMFTVKPGTPEDKKIVEETWSLLNNNLWFINLVEGDAWALLLNSKLGNIPHAGSGAAITFSAEQWYFKN